MKRLAQGRNNRHRWSSVSMAANPSVVGHAALPRPKYMVVWSSVMLLHPYECFACFWLLQLPRKRLFWWSWTQLQQADSHLLESSSQADVVKTSLTKTERRDRKAPLARLVELIKTLPLILPPFLSLSAFIYFFFLHFFFYYLLTPIGQKQKKAL